jgi:hypothetical protein
VIIWDLAGHFTPGNSQDLWIGVSVCVLSALLEHLEFRVDCRDAATSEPVNLIEAPLAGIC